MEEEYSLDIFFKKLEENEKASGKQRWNEICNDITHVYNEYFLSNQRIDTSELWQVLFEPDRKKLEKLFEDKDHKFFFCKVVYWLLDDPADWNIYFRKDILYKKTDLNDSIFNEENFRCVDKSIPTIQEVRDKAILFDK